jgi:alpha-N-arabinofuranosidase
MPTSANVIPRLLHAGLLLAVGTLSAPPAGAGERITITVHPRTVNHVSDRLFGHFMERASWGEPGYDAARVGDTGRLDPRVVTLLKRWNVPVIRWPGGSDIRRIDWRDMIDNVPGRRGERPMFDVSDKHPPLSNRFGLDEFLALCDEVGAEPLLPVNFAMGLRKDKPLDEASQLAAGLVAYCNAPLAARLPEGMPDWPAVRARNGHPEPYGVRWFQIGNEVWHYSQEALAKVGLGTDRATTAQRARWYLTCFNAYADAMLAVDPKIELFTEWNHVGMGSHPKLNEQILSDPAMNKARWFVRHTYSPWAIRKVLAAGEQVDPARLSPEDLWNAWVATPQIDPVGGHSVLPWQREARLRGLKLAVTEWNWNGWWSMAKEDRPAFDSSLAKGVGAAGWLHAFMRLGDQVRLACQSMTVGSRWGITGIRVDPSGRLAPYPLPTGQVTGLYSRHHGNARLAVTHRNVPVYTQPYRMSGIGPAEKVLTLDVVATLGTEALYLHVINRSFGRDLDVQIDLSALDDLHGPAVLHALTGRLTDAPQPGQSRAVAKVTDHPVAFDADTLAVRLPKRSVSVLEIPRRSR